MKILDCFRKVQSATDPQFRLDAPTRERIQREVQRIERMNPDIAPEAAHIAAVDEVLDGLIAQTEGEIERVVKAMEAKPETRAEAQKRGEGAVETSEKPTGNEAKEYAYGMHMRPLQIGAQPKGFTRADEADKRGRHGVIYYNRPLTAEEIASFELKDLNKQDVTEKPIMGERIIAKDWTDLTDQENPPLNRELTEYSKWRRSIASLLLPEGTTIEREALQMELSNAVSAETAKRKPDGTPQYDGWQTHIVAQHIAGELLTGARQDIVKAAKERALIDEYSQWDMGMEWLEDKPARLSVEAYDKVSKGRPLPKGFEKEGAFYVFKPAAGATNTQLLKDAAAGSMDADSAVRDRLTPPQSATAEQILASRDLAARLWPELVKSYPDGNEWQKAIHDWIRTGKEIPRFAFNDLAKRIRAAAGAAAVSNDTAESLKAEITKLDKAADDWRKAYGFGPNSKEFRAAADAATDVRRKLAALESNAGASSKADPLLAKAETLGLTSNILARIAKGQTDEQIGSGLGLSDGKAMAAAVRASGMTMPKNPNLGREWNSPEGRQRIVAVDEMDTGGGPQYTIETVETGQVWNTSDYKGSLEQTIARQEYQLTPEYAEEQAINAKRKAARVERERKEAEEAEVLKQDIANFGAALNLSKLEIGKAQKALMVEVSRDVDGTRSAGPRAKTVKALVAAGYVAKQKDKEWRLQRESDGRYYVVTKTEALFADWIAESATPKMQESEEKEPWQFTREEFREAFEKKSPLIPSIYKTTGEMVTQETTGWGWHVDAKHKQLVATAIAAGKAVPENVIASHPEIVKQRERDAVKAEQKKATAKYLEETRGGNKLRTTPAEGTPEREALRNKRNAEEVAFEKISIEIDALRTKRGKAKTDAQQENIQRAIDGAEKQRDAMRDAHKVTKSILRKAILEDVIEDGEEINAAFALEELTGEKNAELFSRAKAIAVDAFKAAGFNDEDAGFYGTDVVASVASSFEVKDRAFSKYLAFSVDLKTRQRTIWEARAQIEAIADTDARRQFLAQMSPAESRGDVEEAMRVLGMAQKYAASTAAVAKEQAPDPQPTSLRGDAKQVSGSAAAAEASTKGQSTEPKVMKAQKQFITEALAQAIAEAPESIDPAQPKHIKIAVPNDGTFFLVNTKAVLRGFLEKVNKGNAFSRKWVSARSGDRVKETDTGAVPFVTSGFPVGPQTDDTPEPSKIPNQSAVPKLGKPKIVEDWVKITEPFRGNEPSRYQLHGSYGDGDKVYATDGRVAISVNAPNAGKKDALQAFGSPKDKMTVATLDGLKGMLKRKGKALAKGIDTDHLWSMLKAAKQAESDRFHSVRIWINPDHSLGVSLWGNPDTMLDSGAYYAGNMQDNATELGMFNVDYLLQIVGAVRASGSEFLTVSDDAEGEFAYHFTSDSGAVHAMLMQTRSDQTAEQEIEEMARRGMAGLTPEQKQEIQTRAEELLKVKLANLYPKDYVDHFEALNEARLKIPASMADLQYLTARESDKLKDMVFSLLSEGTKYGWSQFASRKADDPAKINMLVGVREQLAKASRPAAMEPMPRKDATAPKPAAPAVPAAPVEEKKAPDPLRNMSESDRAEAVRIGNAIERSEAVLDREWILNLKVRGAIDDPKWDVVMSAQIRRAKLQKLLWEAGFDSLDNLSADVYAALGIKTLAPHLAMNIELDALRDISDYAAEGNKEKLERFKVTNPVESYHWEKYLSKGVALDKDLLDLYNDREAATFAQRFYADSAGSAEKTIRAMYDNDAYSAAEAWIDDHLDRTIDQHIESTRWNDDERNLGVGWSDYSAEAPVYRFTDGKYYTFTKIEMVDGEKVIRIKEIAPRQIVIPKDSVDKGLAAKKSADRRAWIAGGNDREIAPGYSPRMTRGLFDVAKKTKDYTAKIAHARRLLAKIDAMLESEDIGSDRIDSLEGRAAELEKQITDWQRGLVQAQIDRQNREAIAQASASMDAAREKVNEPATPPVNINARHTLDTANVLTPGGALKASVIGNAASDAWHHQGDIQHIFFTDKATVNGQSGSTETTRRTIAEYKAAKAAGWDYVNKRAGSYGTLYVFQRGKEILTNAGAAALVTGKFTAPVVENKAGYEELVRAQSEYAKPFVTWMLTLPDSTLESASAFGAKLSTTAIGKWVSTDQDNTKNGYNFWFARDGKRHIGVSGTDREAAIMKLVALAMPDEEGRAVWKKDENRGWKTIGEALDAYAAATGRIRTGLVDPMTPPAPAQKSAEEAPQATTLLGTRKFLTALLDGEVTAAQVKEQWAKFKASKDQVFADMLALKKDELMRLAGMRASKSDTKESLARSAYSALMDYFNPTDSLQFGMGRDMEASRMAAMEKVVATWTDEMIAQKSEARREAKADRERAAKAPETAEEWEQFVYNRGRQKPTPADTIEFKKLKGRAQFHWLMARGEKMLTPEELAAYDAIRAKDTKQVAQNIAESKAFIHGVTAPTETEIIETKHTQKGHDLFVVKLGDRVERSIYDRLNVAAKKLGGYYSSFKGAGAIPGFQFRSRADAEAFQGIARGESVDRSDEVAANRESKVQSAAERLEAMAERMEAAADESLNADRKTNTAKRAREASGAEQTARRQIAMAKTLKNLAAAMKAGNITHLDGITNATQVATLKQQAARAKDVSERKKELSYQKREELKDVEPTAEQMGDAEYPYPFVHKSDVLKLVEMGRATAGAKLLAERLSKLTLPRDGGEMGHISNPEMIETFRELSKKVSERGKPAWDTYSWKFDDYDRLQRMGIRDLPTLRAALREFVQYQGATPAADPIKMKERALVGKNWTGFFPTPAPIVERMIAEAGIEDGMTVLEPSAGKGDIADAARDAGAMVDTVEIVGELRELLEAKGHNVIGNDIMDKNPRGFTYGDTFKAPDGKTGIMRGHPGGPHSGRVRLDDETGKTLGYYFRAELDEVQKNGSNSGYDRVLMNPPFEEGKDMDHVMHAFSLLRPGGKLVAVMGEGAFSRSDKKATAFREWLDSHEGTSEKLPVGSFSGADAFRQTGTSTRLVIVSRDAENGETSTGLAADVPRDTREGGPEKDAQQWTGRPIAVFRGEWGPDNAGTWRNRLASWTDSREIAKLYTDPKTGGFSHDGVQSTNARITENTLTFNHPVVLSGGEFARKAGSVWMSNSDLDRVLAVVDSADRSDVYYEIEQNGGFNVRWRGDMAPAGGFDKTHMDAEEAQRDQFFFVASALADSPTFIRLMRERGHDGIVLRGEVATGGKSGKSIEYNEFRDLKLQGENDRTEKGFSLFADLPRQTAQIEEEREAILNPDDPNPLKGRSGGQDVRDVFAKVFKGRKDLLDRYAPGAAAAITDGEIDAARYRGAMREMMANLTGELDAVFGETKEGKKKRKAFVAELLPRAARLNPVAYDSKDNFVFADFNMRAGSISEKQADNAGVSTGSPWIGRDGEKLIVGEYLADLKAYQLLRPMSAALQAALYEDFNRKYPETAHYLERFIAPDMADARITDSRGFELPEFNRHALRKFFGDVSPFGEIGNVEGYVPEVSRTRSLAGILSSAVKNALNRNWQSGAREYKTGDARESGEVRDIFAGFGLRALEAASERERRDTAEKLLAIAVKDIPPGGVVPDGWIAVNPQNLSHLANAYASAHGLDGKKLMEFTKAVAAGDMAALKTLVGQAWALLKTNKMIKAEVVKELVRPLTDRVIRNKFVALVDSLSKSYIGGLLAHPFSWITNITSNELFKLMRIAQRALYGGFIKAAGWVSKDMARDPIQKGGKLALMEAWELTKGLLYARKWNQKQIDSVVSPELFEGNTSISGAVRSMTEDQMTAWDFLKQANVPQAILKAVNYSGMDVKAKQAIAYASYMAQAQVAADDAMKKGIRFADKKQRMEWMKNWLTTAPAEVHRRAHATAVAYAMDYENVPWWMDEKSASPGWNIVRRLMFPFIKWPYNMARQMKRFGLDSAIDLAAWTAGRTIGHVPGAIGETMRSWQSSRKASGAKMANSVAHLATFGMMYAAMRALLGAAKDDDEVERLGRSFDQAGNRLGREWDTSNRINITDVPILGTAVAALAKMHGDTGENDYWLRVRNVPYAGPMLAMASTMSWVDAVYREKPDASGRADEAKNAWREFVSDFWSEGILLSSMNAIHGNESKYTAGQPVSATLGGAFMDLATSRIAPVPVLSAIRDTVDPEMRRLNDSKTLEYAPGFIEGMESRIPGLSDNLPPKGQVKTKLAANAVKDLAKVEHPKAKRIYTNPTTGKTMATYVDPEDKRDIPRWRTLLRIAGANVKPVNRAGYKTAVAGKEQAAAYRKAMRILNDD